MNQFVPFSTDTVMALDHMFGRILIEMIIKGVTPLAGTFFFPEKRNQGLALHILGDGHARHL